MRMRGKHITLLVIMAAMLVVVGVWSAGAGLGRTGDTSTGRPVYTQTEASVPSLSIPSIDELRDRADYVSPDGHEVRIGDVGISAGAVVSRSALD